jgi:hypothetical protein
VAAFVPLVVWADNYPNYQSAFYFGTFRYLNTTVGILIYTMVDLVLWPRQAGNQLQQLGRSLWGDVRNLFGQYCRELAGPSEEASSVRSKVAGTLARASTTLQDAYFDTPAIRGQKRRWEALRCNTRDLIDALELWHASIQDCRELDLDRLVPQLASALDTLQDRLKRIGELWQAGTAVEGAGDTTDSLLMETLPLNRDPLACEALSHLQRAAFANFMGQLHALDQASRELLRALRAISGLESGRDRPVAPRNGDLKRLAGWDPTHFMHALYPPVCFLSACIFWIVMNPPTGPKIPMFAGILALVVVRSAANPVAMIKVNLFSALFAVAPIYWLVMPGMSTGFELLGLIFVYSFVFGFLAGRSPVFKMGPILMFVVMTGISNQQKYSFTGLVDGLLMILLAGVILAVVYVIFTPLRPEQSLLQGLRRFFRGCARFTESLAVDDPADQSRGPRRRKRYLQSMVAPAAVKVRALRQQLDYRMFPDNPPEKTQRLVDSLQSIAYRLQAMEIAYDRVASRIADFPQPVATLGKQLCGALQTVFEHWASRAPGDAFEQQRSLLQQRSQQLEQQFDALPAGQDHDGDRDALFAAVYTILGSLRGLIDSMAHAQNVINQINWQQWATARF